MKRMGGILIACLVAGCAGGEAEHRSDASPAELTPAARGVRTAKGDAPSGCEEIGPVEGKDGYARAGGLGGARVGTYERAYVNLRNVAAERGANYVRLDAEEGPHAVTKNVSSVLFVLRGVAFKCPPQAP
jgi:Domain of unknown function (DUF4156)